MVIGLIRNGDDTDRFAKEMLGDGGIIAPLETKDGLIAGIEPNIDPVKSLTVATRFLGPKPNHAFNTAKNWSPPGKGPMLLPVGRPEDKPGLDHPDKEERKTD